MFFNCHNHTMYSNLRLLDCIIKPKDLIDKAIELGLSGIAITDHEALSAHMEVNIYAKKIREKYPDFTIALGNEIYLTETRGKNQPYYHFILIAKDELGYMGLRELSSTAWYNSYYDRGMERVPTLKSELQNIMPKYKGHIIATTACMGGELSRLLLAYDEVKKTSLPFDDTPEVYLKKIDYFINFCIEIFGRDNFFIECAPSSAKDQILVNQYLIKIAKKYGLNMVPGTDSHYLNKETRFAHKAYLNSKGGDREVDSFYEFARLMDEKEVRELLSYSFNEQDINDIMLMTEAMRKQISWYSLEKSQRIPVVEIPKREGFLGWSIDSNRYPTLDYINRFGNEQEQYWLDCCINSLIDKKLDFNNEYFERLEIEADVIKFIGSRLSTCLFAYFNTFKHYIDLFWDCGSIVGPGRGSATGFLSNYLLGITQLDPIKWNLPWWRFLNKERAELPDIDIDLAPSKRREIFQRIREERGEKGLIQVITFGTEGSKSAVLTACRGYRRLDEDGIEMYPEGIDVDVAQYIASLIPSHRGFLWPIKDVVYGNKDEDRQPITAFKREVDNYPGLLDIIFAIEGIVKQRGCHASGVIMYDVNKIYETAAIMRTPSGDLVTCYDLHMAEAAGDTKYDFLVTEVSDKIIKCLELLQKDEVIESDMTLRQLYEKYLHPEHINTENPKIWEALANGSVLDVFQFNSGVGLAIAKKLKPSNPLEMTAANAMMRLMSEKGKESQQDRYVRIKNQGIKVFDDEMKAHNLPSDMIKAMHKHCDKYYGCCAIQEQMMEILMDQNIACFTLKEANDARKIVAKKQMSRIPELKNKVYDVMSERLADYIWEVAVAPQLGYAFSMNHSLPYSFVGIQTIILATEFDPIYWNTACLIVNSGATDEDIEGTTNYGKIAKAIGDIKSAGIDVSTADINHSEFGFTPDIGEGKILYGLKGLLNVGDDVIQEIISKRPFTSFYDFLSKVKCGKQATISLIKGGAFDRFGERKRIMAEYLWLNCDKKKRITLQNMNGLIQRNLLPHSLDAQRACFEFNRYLKNVLKSDNGYYILDDRALAYLDRNYSVNLEIYGNTYALNQKQWNTIYQIEMDKVRAWMNENQQEALYQLNKMIFKEEWDKYAKGNYSAWEMEALCFYYHEHELQNVNRARYGISNFFDLPEEPVIEKTFKRGGVDIPIYRLNKICGTCIAKNRTKGTVTLLTPDGAVEVKFRNEYFSLFDKQISAKGADGVKHVIEKSWFNRGSMILVMGIRRGDDFIPKRYASTPGHQLYKIEEILPNGSLKLRSERAIGEAEDE